MPRIHAQEVEKDALHLLLMDTIPETRRRAMYNQLQDCHIMQAPLASAKPNFAIVQLWKAMQRTVAQTMHLPDLTLLLQDVSISASTRAYWMTVGQDDATSEANWPQMLALLEQAHLARTIVKVNQELLRLGNDDVATIPDWRARIHTLGEEITQAVTQTTNRMRSVHQRANKTEYSATFDAATKIKPGLRRWPTGWPTFDKGANGGLSAGEVLLIAAPTGGGKSTAAGSVALSAYSAGARVRYYSYEMAEDDLLRRMYAAVSGIPTGDMDRGLDEIARRKLKTYIWEVLLSASHGDLHIRVPDLGYARQTVADVAVEVAHDPCDVLILDYIGLMDVYADRRLNEEQGLRKAINDIKAMAGQLGCAVVVLAQLDKDGKLKHARSLEDAVDFYVGWHYERGDDIISVEVRKHRRWASSEHKFGVVTEWECARFREAPKDVVEDMEARKTSKPATTKLDRMNHSNM